MTWYLSDVIIKRLALKWCDNWVISYLSDVIVSEMVIKKRWWVGNWDSAMKCREIRLEQVAMQVEGQQC